MRHLWLRGLLFLLDFIVLELAFFAIFWWRFQTGMFENPVTFTALEQVVPSLFVSVFWILHFAVFGLYRFDPLESRSVVAVNAAYAAGYGCLIIFLATFDPGNPLPVTRVILLTYGLGVTAGIAFSRLALLTVLQELRLRGMLTMRAIVVGSGERLATVLHQVRHNRFVGAQVLGVVSSSRPPDQSERFLGKLSALRKTVAKQKCDLIYLALEESDLRQLNRAVTLISALPVRLFVPADHYQLLLGKVRPLGKRNLPLIEIRGDILTPIESALKRVFDVVVAALLLAVTLPIWLLAAIAILLDTGYPVFFAQTRVGLHGKLFRILKFRSMITNAEEETGPAFVGRGDPRITRVGKILRSTRIDELPQLLNILAGRMSLVGPRPERPEFAAEFARLSPLFNRRLNVKPGLTGWAQVHLHYDATVSAPEKKLEMDIYYIENMSLPLDMKILYMTLFVVLRGEG